MIKKLPKSILFLLLVFVPSIAFSANLFQAVPTDLSLRYLSFIFGNVPNVLPAGTNTAVGVVLGAFNNSVLVLGGIIILYGLIVGTVNTANDGEMLGKDWGSMWVPLRSAFGFSLLLPINLGGAGGYSLIQIFFMWIVTQGVYAADHIWFLGVNSIQSGSVSMTPNPSQFSPNYASAQTIFLSLVCAKQASMDINDSTTIPPLSEVETPFTSGSTSGVYFGVPGVSNSMCTGVNYDDSSEKNIINPQIDAMIQSLDGVANDYIQQYNSDPTYFSTNAAQAQQAYSGAILNAANTFQAQVNAGLAAQNAGSGTSGNSALAEVVQKGWVNAGSYFLVLSEQLNTQSSGSTVTINTISPSGGNSPSEKVPDSQTFEKEMQTAQSVTTQTSGQVKSLSDFNSVLNENLSGVQQAFTSIFVTFAKYIGGGGGSQASPLAVLQAAGTGMYRGGMVAWLAVTTGLFLAAGASNAAANTTLGIGIKQIGAFVYGGLTVITLYLLTVLVGVCGVIVATGITFAFYIPIIPFIVFTMGVINWLILVIEAMVAAPLVAIGVIHPEGKHQIFGEGANGVMLIAGIFLRPSLMIIGFFASIQLSYVITLLITIGYTPLVANLSGNTPGLVIHFSIIGLLMMIVMYVTLITIGLNKAFSVISHLPNQVMRWIGGAPESSGAEREVEQLQQTSEEGKGGLASNLLSKPGEAERQRRNVAQVGEGEELKKRGEIPKADL